MLNTSDVERSAIVEFSIHIMTYGAARIEHRSGVADSSDLDRAAPGYAQEKPAWAMRLSSELNAKIASSFQCKFILT